MPNPNITDAQMAKLQAVVTRPIYVMQLNHSGVVEYLSCNGPVTFDGQAYSGGGAMIRSISDTKAATVVVPNSAARFDEIQTRAWDAGICKIWYIPALPSDGDTFVAADGIFVFDGVINASALTGELVMISALNKYFTGAMSPVFTFDQVCGHIPPAGTILEWENTSTVLEQQTIDTTDRHLTLGGYAAPYPGASVSDLFKYKTSA